MTTIYVQTLDADALQQALDNVATNTFTVGRAKLSDGARPVYYSYTELATAEQIAAAATVAAEQDSLALTQICLRLLDDLQRVEAKSLSRRSICKYTATDAESAQVWLSNPKSPVPLKVQVRAMTRFIDNTVAAEQIVALYQNWTQYSDQISALVTQATTNIMSSNSVRDCKVAYTTVTVELEKLENIDFND